MARSHEKTSAPGTGRSAYQSSQPIGETPHGPLDQSVAPAGKAGANDDWGYRPRKGGMALEARLGMFIVVILLCAFGFLVYRKFDQHALIAGETGGGIEDALRQSVEEDGDSAAWIKTDSYWDGEQSAPASAPEYPLAQRASVADVHPDEDPQFTADWNRADDDNGADADSGDDADPFDGLLDDLSSDDTTPDSEFGSEDVDLAASEPGTAVESDDDFAFDSEPLEPLETADDAEQFSAALPPINVPEHTPQPEVYSAFEQPDELRPQDTELPERDQEFGGTPLPYADDIAMDFDDASNFTDLPPASPEPDSPEPFDDIAAGPFHDDSDFDAAILAADDDFMPPAESLEQPPAYDLLPPSGEDSFEHDERKTALNVASEDLELLPFSPPPDLGEDSDLDELLFDKAKPADRESPDMPIAADDLPLPFPSADATNEAFDDPDFSEPAPDDDFLADDNSLPPLPVDRRYGDFHDVPADDKSVIPFAALDEFADDTRLREPQYRRGRTSPVSSQVIKASAEQDACDVCEVKPNDNYWKISRRVYGSSRYYSALARYNQHRIANPRHLRPGMKVLIPSTEDLESRYPKLFRSIQPQEEARSGYFVQSDGSAAYRIGRSDTLSEIAEKHLGRSSRWIEIYRSNRNALPNPNKLKPGTVIVLPDDATDVHVIP